jgi:hypothetical protein
MLDPTTNIAFIRSNPGYKSFRIFSALANCITESGMKPIFTGASQSIPDSDEDKRVPDDETVRCSNTSKARPFLNDGNFDDSAVNIEEDIGKTTEDTSAELLRWHYRHYHLSFSAL